MCLLLLPSSKIRLIQLTRFRICSSHCSSGVQLLITSCDPSEGPAFTGKAPCSQSQENQGSVTARILSATVGAYPVPWRASPSLGTADQRSAHTQIHLKPQGFFNKGIKDGFCRLPGKLAAPASGRSRREQIPAGNCSPCPASSAARLQGAPAGTPPLPVPGDLQASRNTASCPDPSLSF